MDLQIGTSGGDERDLASLHRWLSQDAAFARHARVSRDSVAPTPGGMGGAFDVINAVLADAGAVAGLGSLLIAFKTWRATRSRPPAMTIRYGDVTVTVAEGQ
ncbi:effector-associated constant component EACC1 [Spirillospora sp. CA-255316]